MMHLAFKRNQDKIYCERSSAHTRPGKNQQREIIVSTGGHQNQKFLKGALSVSFVAQRKLHKEK